MSTGAPTPAQGVRAPKLELRGIRKVFGSRKGEVVGLDTTDVVIGDNEFATLVGPSGCGKSTLLAIVGGLETPTEGEILLDGQPVFGPGRDRGMVFQSYTLFPWLTVQQNVEFALRDEPASRTERTDRALQELRNVGLERFAGAHPKELSGGMKQRVAIARALVYRPKVLLMDEPFGALDAQTRADMQELLTSVWEAHQTTVLFVTHDVDEAVFISDRVYVMSPHPGSIDSAVDITLERPRVSDMQLGSDFIQHKADILGQIRRR